MVPLGRTGAAGQFGRRSRRYAPGAQPGRGAHCFPRRHHGDLRLVARLGSGALVFNAVIGGMLRSPARSMVQPNFTLIYRQLGKICISLYS